MPITLPRAGPAAQGRLVIPSQLRHLLGFEPGNRLVAILEDGRLILEKRETIITTFSRHSRSISRLLSTPQAWA